MNRAVENRRGFKDALYGQLARIGKSLASPKRLELLELLSQSERTVEALARETAMSVASTSQHLQALREARVVEARKEGLYVHYRLATPEVITLLRALRQVAELQLAEMDRIVSDYLGDRNALDAITREELLARARAEEVLVLDVRPEQEFRAGHIAGALSIPIAELEQRLQELPKRKEIVAYCRGPYCVYADEAVALLRAKGRKARRFEEGFPDWRAAGLPSEPAPERES
jgi:rhodanese-related sulfurtransferase/DNA-binding transcriptional ArsR family regulator